jgi:hypothetical protein
LSEFSECVTEDITTLLIQQSYFPEEGVGQWVWLVAVSIIYFPYETRCGVTQGPWLCHQHRRWQRKVSRSGKRRCKWPRRSVFCAPGSPVCRPWSQSPKTSEIHRDFQRVGRDREGLSLVPSRRPSEPSWNAPHYLKPCHRTECTYPQVRVICSQLSRNFSYTLYQQWPYMHTWSAELKAVPYLKPCRRTECTYPQVRVICSQLSRNFSYTLYQQWPYMHTWSAELKAVPYLKPCRRTECTYPHVQSPRWGGWDGPTPC